MSHIAIMGEWQLVIGLAIIIVAMVVGAWAIKRWCAEDVRWALYLAWERIKRDSEDRTCPEIPVYVDWREYRVVDKLQDPWWVVTYGSERKVNVAWRASA